MKKLEILLLGILVFTACVTHLYAEDTEGDDTDTTEQTNGEESDTEGLDEEPEVSEENGVLVLTDDNFDDVVYNKDIILVEFYAPWCGHCKQLAPEYEKAAESLKNDGSDVVLAKLDATVHEATARRFDVSGYPTLKFFKKGQVYDYEGPRSEPGISKYMTERADPNWAPPPEAVITLGNDNFTDFIFAHDLSLVEFYAPWCGHCKRLAPEYEKAAQELQKDTPPIPLAKVDATEATELAKKYDVSGYPTLKVFRRGKEFEYKGEREKYGIMSYMRKQVGDASREKQSLKDLKAAMQKEDVTVVGFFKNEDAKEYETYQAAANDLREDYTFYHSFDEEARNHYKVNLNSVVVFNAERFYTKFESKWHTLEVQYETEMQAIEEHIKSHNVPLVGHFQQSTKDKRYGGKRPLVLFFYSVDFSFDYIKTTQMWRQKIADIAKNKKYKDLTFAIADEEQMASDFKEFGFEDSAEEMNVGILDEKNRKYPMEPMDEFDSEEITEFLDKFVKGKIKPKVKSQPVPKKQKGPVTVLVGRNFEEIVEDPKKDVLVEFYAPWCGHCKKLEPVYKELAKKYKNDKNLVIAKMDATANDSPPQYEVQGFPTIYLAQATNKDQPLKMDGGRELSDFVKFLEEHATVSLGKNVKEEL